MLYILGRSGKNSFTYFVRKRSEETLRGCQRKIILLKGTDSQIFDEAYFLLRRGAETFGNAEIIREAERIVNRNTTRRRRRVTRRDGIAFVLGIACGIACGLLIGIVL